jgi:hypothetical protein
MTRKTLRDVGSEAADIAAALILRNAIVISGLVAFALIALARP